MDENNSMTANEISEQIFKAIDAIVLHRLAELKFDRVVLATIKDSTDSAKGKYIVTTDNNITFDAYSDRVDLFDGLQIYVRIPQGDYTKRKVITGLYEPIEIQQQNNYQLSNLIETELKKFNLYYKGKNISLTYELKNNLITNEEYQQQINQIKTIYNINKQTIYEQYGAIMPNFNDIVSEFQTTYWV